MPKLSTVLPRESTRPFVPDIVRRCEPASPTRLSRECRLALAILEDAIHIYRMEGSGRRNLRLRLEAARWFSSDDRSWCFSFERICEVLELDSDCIRRGLKAPSERRAAARAATDSPITALGGRAEERLPSGGPTETSFSED